MKISGQKIEIIMVEKGLTNSALAERIGVSRQNLSTIKNRGSCWTSTAAKIAEGLGCTIRDITPTESEE